MEFNWTEFLINAALFWLAFKIGQTRGRLEVLKEIIVRPDEINRIVKKFNKEEQQESRGEETMEVERHGDQIYVYTKTGEFLAQGLTLQECLDRIESRFPDRKFRGHLSKEQADSLGVSVK
jgi:hypothetical protein